MNRNDDRKNRMKKTPENDLISDGCGFTKFKLAKELVG